MAVSASTTSSIDCGVPGNGCMAVEATGRRARGGTFLGLHGASALPMDPTPTDPICGATEVSGTPAPHSTGLAPISPTACDSDAP